MLKERIISLLEKDPECLDMTLTMIQSAGRLLYSFEALILKVAGYHLQGDELDGTLRLPLNAPILLRKWVDYEVKLRPYLTEGMRAIPATARQVWEGEYGEVEAMALPFYEDELPDVYTVRWWDSLRTVRPDMIINFLRGEGVYELNGPTTKRR